MSAAAPVPEIRFGSARAAVALGLVSMLLLVLLGRVYWLQTRERARILDKADRQQHITERLPARRGSIFDSTGQLLAGAIQTQTIFLDPKEIIDAYQERERGTTQLDADMARLGALIERDPFELVRDIGDKYPGRYLEVAHDVDDRVIADINKLNMPGIGTTPSNQRIYPMGSLAAHILGGVGADGKGLEGLELTCDKLLSGVDGLKRSMKDSHRRSIGTDADDYTPAQHGKHLVLTVDANIQLLVEQELAATVKQYDAAAGEAVVLDPKTGNIVALANYPSFTPQFIEQSKPANRTNRALVSPYEPGSTIKPFIVSRALDKKEARLTDIITMGGKTWKTPYGRTITDVHGYDSLPLWDVLVKSSNIGMSQLGERMGNPELHAALNEFGFGQKSGIDLPGEDDGVVKPLRKWGKSSTESIAQGYELLVTPMQMARGMCTIANGGTLVTPNVIKGTLDDDSTTVEPLAGKSATPTFPRIIDEATANSVRRVLADIPVRGTATKARSDVYNIFGKTGTAHRAVDGKYDQHHYTSSFVGGAPYEDPRLVIAFVIHDPDRAKAHYGGIVAAPGASRILEKALTYLQVPASPTLALPPANVQPLLNEWSAKLYEKDKKPTLVKAD